MEQALKDGVRTVTPGFRSLGPNALASPGLLGSAEHTHTHNTHAHTRSCTPSSNDKHTHMHTYTYTRYTHPFTRTHTPASNRNHQMHTCTQALRTVGGSQRQAHHHIPACVRLRELNSASTHTPYTRTRVRMHAPRTHPHVHALVGTHTLRLSHRRESSHVRSSVRWHARTVTGAISPAHVHTLHAIYPVWRGRHVSPAPC